MPIATAKQTIGPYSHLIEDPSWSDLPRFGAPGEKIVLAGSIYDGAGQQVVDATIERWQTSAESSDTFPAFGLCRADFNGSFQFKTLGPGPAAGIGNAQQAPHVAIAIFARGLLKALTTRLNFQVEPLNETDPVFSLIEDSGRRRTLLVRKVSSETWQLNIRLRAEGETIFMEI